MTSAIIVGSRGAGLTTFVGLLYTAQVRLATEEDGDGSFRFHAPRETLRHLEAIYGELGAGRFPTRDVDFEEHSLSFVLSSPRRRTVPWPRGGGSSPSSIRIGGVTTEELAELRAHESVVGESTRLLYHSPVVILLVDASRLRCEADGPAGPFFSENDAQLAAALEVLGRYLSTEPKRKARTMHPLFVLTKLDRCPAAAHARLHLPAGPVAGWSENDRQRVGQNAFASYLPATGRWLSQTSGGRGSVSIALPRWYFSSLRIESGEGGPQIARRSRFPIGSWEPEYPYEEYRALIEHLGELSQRLPDVGES